MKNLHATIFMLALCASAAFAQTKPATPVTPDPTKAPSSPTAKTTDATAKAAKTDTTKLGAGEKDTRRQVFILELGGMVGVGLRHNEMEAIEK